MQRAIITKQQGIQDNSITEDGRSPRQSAPLPTDYEHFIRAVVTGILEVLCGLRQAEQLARWVNDQTYRQLVHHSTHTRDTTSTEHQRHRTPFVVGTVKIKKFETGHVESSVVVQFPSRTRAVAVHLIELHSGRLRVENICLL